MNCFYWDAYDPGSTKPLMSLCECGCGLPAPIAKVTRTNLGHVRGKPIRFISGHNRQTRPRESTYKRRSLGANTQKSIHVEKAERALGKRLPAKAQVHHLDENPSNNENSNLIICPNLAYHKLLHLRTRAKKATGDPKKRKCNICLRWDDIENMKPVRTRSSFYHVVCQRQRLREWRTNQ